MPLFCLRLGRALLVVFAKMDGLSSVGQTAIEMGWDAGGGMVIGSATQLVIKEPSGLLFPGKGGDGKTMVQYLNVGVPISRHLSLLSIDVTF